MVEFLTERISQRFPSSIAMKTAISVENALPINTESYKPPYVRRVAAGCRT
jgi:hypothetical protein